MPRYAPLPYVSIDPRNEAQLVQQASQRVYQASNKTLNDFSAGNPLAVLLEGQAFAQGEFLFWANQLPEKILIEWLGPFLGALRRLGTPSVARIVLYVDPSDEVIRISAGTRFSTNPNLTGGESFSFLLDKEVIIPPGETTTTASVTSEYVGSIYNSPANSIVNSGSVNINGLTVTNPQPATGGSDVETFDQVQERFFTLIRRRNPVSDTDWQNFFIDLFGLGTITSVQPNRPSPNPYNYQTDYQKANGQISFFVLGPTGVELTDEQLSRGQNVVNFSVPVEFKAHLYPMTLSEVQYSLKVEVNANGPYSGNFKEASLDFRNTLYNALTPGLLFPVSAPPTISEVDAAFYSSFPATTRYVDPNIIESAAFNTPFSLNTSSATYGNIRAFEPTEELLSLNDLVETTLPSPVYYPVVEAFTPYSSSKKDQTIYGNLALKQIKLLAAGTYTQGDVVHYAEDGNAGLRIILDNITIPSTLDIPTLVTQGKISTIKTFSPWVEGNTYQNTSGGFLNPELIQYDYEPDEFIPVGSVTYSIRPGALVWYVAKNFTLEFSTNDLTGAQGATKLGGSIVVRELTNGDSYSAGEWIQTPQVGSGPNEEIDPYYYYVDTTKGAVTKYAYVISSFVCDTESLTISEYFEAMVLQGVIKEVAIINGDNGLPIYKYKPRFPVCQYLEYRSQVTDEPSYYVAAEYFTPNSQSIQDLLDQNLVYALAPTDANKIKLQESITLGSVKKPVKMFTFFRGEQTFFREGSRIKSYIASENVTPLFEFYVYLNNGVFIPFEEYQDVDSISFAQYVPYFNPLYSQYAEDIVLSENGKNFYRVMAAFTPAQTVTGWTGTQVVNTARQEEYSGNLLRIVKRYDCNEAISSQLGKDISAIKLGVAQITLVPKNSSLSTNPDQQYVYVWENTNSETVTPELSWFTGTQYSYNPPDYRNGTLSL